MLLKSVFLKNFRCFTAYQIALESPFILLSGKNGSGKTSVIEALHYACYLTSFRTHQPKDMIAFGEETCFIKIEGISEEYDWTIQAGFDKKKRSIKVNNTAATSYKDLIDTYRVISIMEDDLQFIHGSPDYRRQLINQLLILLDPSLYSVLKKYRTILEQRNAALESGMQDPILYDVWTMQLWELTKTLHEHRIHLIDKLQLIMQDFVGCFFDDRYLFSLHYITKRYKITSSYNNFLEENKALLQQERLYKRSLFGAHLDDITLLFHDKISKQFASRGQQKLLVVLLKLAHHKIINKSSLILVDDFITDFDDTTIALLLQLFTSLKSQLIITTPSLSKAESIIKTYNPLQINLSNTSHGN
ncbi:MAG: DNA replication and repair protein RecF [Candidatus Babeliaceae bacterium]